MNFIERFKDAVIGFSGYPRLLKDKAGGFGYIALLLLIVMAISGAIGTWQARQGMAQAADKLAAAPDFSLSGGEVHFSGPMPYRIDIGNGAVVIVDTTGQTTEADIKNARPNSILITKDTLYQVRSFGGIQSTDLKSLPLSFDKSTIISLMKSMWMLAALFYVLAYGFQLGAKALDACILALIAQAYGSSQRRVVPFELGFKAGLYAMTLPILIQWIPFDRLIPFAYSSLSKWFFVWWGLAILYVIMGMRAYFDSPDEGPEIPTL